MLGKEETSSLSYDEDSGGNAKWNMAFLER
jgi:hypothetical protein